MTTEAAVKQHLAALQAVLAAATKEARNHGPTCSCCQPTSVAGVRLVARFPEFRRVCSKCIPLCKARRGAGLLCHCRAFANKCCNGLGWQIHAGGLAAGLAGLTRKQAAAVYEQLAQCYWKSSGVPDGPMPDRDTIELAELEVVCKAAELEVPDA